MRCAKWIAAWLSTVLAGLAVTLDPIFNQGPGVDGFVEQALPLSDGKVLICGDFTKYNNEPANCIARLNEDGSLDKSFRANVPTWVRHMVVQTDGKILIGGAFPTVDGVPRSLVARLNADGSLDRKFDPGSGFEEKLVEADPNPPYIFWMELQPDGKLLATGSFAKYRGQRVNGFVRINPDGTIDESFKSGSGLDSWGRFVRVLPDGQILLSGWFTSYDGFVCNRLVRLDPDGTPDTTFRPYFGDKTSIYSAAPLPDGRYIVSGHSKNEQGLFKLTIARLNHDGSTDPTFLVGSNERNECVLIQPDGKILVSGWFISVNNNLRTRLVRLLPDGTVDPDYSIDINYFVWNIAFDDKGRLLAAGGFTSIGGQERRGVARLIDAPIEPPVNPPPKAPTLSTPLFVDGAWQMYFQSEKGHNYVLESCGVFPPRWNALPGVPGTGQEISLRDPKTNSAHFYRVRVE